MIKKHIKYSPLLKSLYAKLRNNLFKVRGDVVNQKRFVSMLMDVNNNRNMQALKLLNKLFAYSQTNELAFSEEYIELFVKYASHIRGYYDLSTDCIHQLLEDSRELDPNSLTSDKWLEYCHLCMLNGMFQLGAIIRSKAIESSYIEANFSTASKNQIYRAFKAAVDQADYQYANNMLEMLSSTNMDDKDLIKCRLFLSMCQGDLETVSSLARSFYSNADRLFYDYLKNKEVALVGPAPLDNNNGKEIDSHEVVVRLSYVGGSSFADTNILGAKINISYYGDFFSEAISKLPDYDFLKKLDYTVFKTIRYQYQKELYKAGKSRVLFSPNDCFFNGSAHMIQNALFDLLCFSPNRIKLYNVNFFLSTKMHYDGYSKILRRRKGVKRRYYERHANHKYLSSLNYTRNLWNSGIIEVDNFCSEVLNMTSEDYMSEMQKIYINQE